MARGRPPFHFSLFSQQTNRVGVGSVPLVAVVSLFLGLTIALLTGYQLRRYGSERLVPALVGVSFTRELGALLTGIMLAARIGAAFTAELGTMVVSEEVQAIEGMGIGPLRYLMAPRLLAVFFMMPFLSVVSFVSGLLGAAFISRITMAMSYSYFYQQVIRNLLVRDIVTGTLKSALFGLLIGWIACYKGFTARNGAASVGNNTTESVVIAITTVIGCDALCNVLLFTTFK